MHETPFIIPIRLTTHEFQWWPRTDARSTPPSIGGWFSMCAEPKLESIHWFQFDIKEDLFDKICGEKIDIMKRISSLALLAIVVGVRCWGHMLKNMNTKFGLFIETDSMVAKNSLAQWRAKMEPVHFILRELIIIATLHNIDIRAQHLPGEQNEWAGAISKKYSILEKLSKGNRNLEHDPNDSEFSLSRGKVPWLRQRTGYSYTSEEHIRWWKNV